MWTVNQMENVRKIVLTVISKHLHCEVEQIFNFCTFWMACAYWWVFWFVYKVLSYLSVRPPMNTSAQAVHFNMDELPVSRFTDTAEDGVSRLDPSIHSNQICFFNVDWLFHRKWNGSAQVSRLVVSWTTSSTDVLLVLCLSLNMVHFWLGRKS